MDYDVFQNEIKNLKPYYREVEKMKAEIEILWYQLTGVKGIRYDIEHASFNPSLAEQKKLEMLDKIEQKEKILNAKLLDIQNYETNLNALPEEVREYAIEKFVERKTFRQIGKKHNYNANTIHYRLKKAVEEL